MRENWIKTKYVKKMFVKKFRPGRVAVVQQQQSQQQQQQLQRMEAISSARLVLEDDDSSPLVIGDGEKSSSLSSNHIEWMHASSPNELLHLASSYGDVIHMLYAFALDADRNAIIDKAHEAVPKETSNNDDHGHQTTANGYSHKGYTPLIKAVLSVNKTIIFL